MFSLIDQYLNNLSEVEIPKPGAPKLKNSPPINLLSL